MSDVEGLHRAYARDNGIFNRNNIMFVAGTKDFPQDHWDDFSKIPIHTTYNTLRYINAGKAVTTNDALYPNQQLTSIVGHSLSAVGLELQKTTSIYDF